MATSGKWGTADRIVEPCDWLTSRDGCHFVAIATLYTIACATLTRSRMYFAPPHGRSPCLRLLQVGGGGSIMLGLFFYLTERQPAMAPRKEKSYLLTWRRSISFDVVASLRLSSTKEKRQNPRRTPLSAPIIHFISLVVGQQLSSVALRPAASCRRQTNRTWFRQSIKKLV
ncbi:hypothetical protein GW17_00025088 [Ensete ventricosum]|nr:hypothetical protein GW17_00025088 [Ensete ventricosum]RZS27455.1 hypothetical protein BHM03_00060921 [Ensete ventricosum]